MSILRSFKKVDVSGETPTVDLGAVKASLEFGHNQYKAFKHALDVISVLENWNNAAGELQKQIETLQGVHDGISAQIADAKEGQELVLKQAHDIITVATEEAKRITDAAKAEAQKVYDAKIAPIEAAADQLTADVAELAEEKAALLATNSTLSEANALLAAQIDSIKKSLGV